MKRTVLFVDDDIDEIELLKEAMSEIDHNVECHYALNGQQALSILEGREIRPDMIFIDINMPIMNGWEFLTYVKSSPRLKEIPVVVYTTSNQDKDRSKAIMLGAHHYITKPEDYRSLKKELASLVFKVERIFLYLRRYLNFTTMIFARPLPG